MTCYLHSCGVVYRYMHMVRRASAAPCSHHAHLFGSKRWAISPFIDGQLSVTRSGDVSAVTVYGHFTSQVPLRSPVAAFTRPGLLRDSIYLVTSGQFWLRSTQATRARVPATRSSFHRWHIFQAPGWLGGVHTGCPLPGSCQLGREGRASIR
jgi:hypothetical protein